MTSHAPAKSSRFARTRYYLTGTLIAESPIHIGSLDGLEVDQPFARDGAGHPIIPGTALAGVLRPGRDESELWGGDAATDGERTTVTSRITLDDCVLIPPESAHSQSEIRDHVSLNRFTGAAEPGFLYSQEVLPEGSKFAFRCTIDLEGEAESTVPEPPAEIRNLAIRLCTGVSVGGATSRGLGRVRLIEAAVHFRRLSNAQELKAFVNHRLRQGQGSGASSTQDPAPEKLKLDLPKDWPNGVTPAVDGQGSDQVTEGDPVASTVRITVPWQAKGPVLVASAPQGDAVDVVPLVARTGDRVRLVLPGSSIKGALRNHAERILRTVLDLRSGDRPGAEGYPSRALHLADLAANGGMQLVGLLFGTPGDSSQVETGGERSGRKGAVTVHECHSTCAWDADKWERTLNASRRPEGREGRPREKWQEQTDLLMALNGLNTSAKRDDQESKGKAPPFLIGDHVAIDRWTGGAADGALYSVLEPWLTQCGDWEPIVLDIDWARLCNAQVECKEEPNAGANNYTKASSSGMNPDASAPGAALALLALTLRDFCEGWIPLGYGASKGYGSVHGNFGEVALTKGPGSNDVCSLESVLAIGSTEDGAEKSCSNLKVLARKDWIEWCEYWKPGGRDVSSGGASG